MKRLRGFAILTAIFILVVLAALGAFILGVSSGQQIGSALDVVSARAYQAARAGVEWGLYKQLQSASCTAGPTSFTPAGSTFAGLTVSVTCSSVTDGGVTVYTLTSTACNQRGADGNCPCTASAPSSCTAGSSYVERRLTVTF